MTHLGITPRERFKGSGFKVQGSGLNLNIGISVLLKSPEAYELLNPEPGTEQVQGYSEHRKLCPSETAGGK